MEHYWNSQRKIYDNNKTKKSPYLSSFSHLIHPTKRTLILDMEVTGYSHRHEIAYLEIRTLSGECLYQTWFEVEEPCSTHLETRWLPEWVEDPKKWTSEWTIIESLLSGTQVIGINAPFLERLMRQTCTRYDLSYPSDGWEWQCAMKWLHSTFRCQNFLKVASEIGYEVDPHLFPVSTQRLQVLLWFNRQL